MEWPRAGVGVIVFKDRTASDVLLVQRGKPPAHGLWAPPGGRIEAGETVAEAAAREVHEECGLHVSVPEDATFASVDVIERAEAGGIAFHYVLVEVVAFCDTTRGRSHRPVAGDDAVDCRWWSADELHEAQPRVRDLERIVALARRHVRQLAT